MSLEVSGASKFTQSAAEAPASVSVITAADIRSFGYRTLADALRTVNGMYVQYDRIYSYLGVRGFARPGDYNSRVLILVDGYRINDSVYDQGFLGREFPVDLDLVDRIEIIRGPGSAMYGSNALFAVINVITRRASDFGKAEATVEAGSRRSRNGRLSLGRTLDNGAEMLLSVSDYDSDGSALTFDKLGTTRNTDYEHNRSFLGKLAFASASLEVAHSSRLKGTPGSFYAAVFDDPINRYDDTQTFLNLAWYTRPSDSLEVNASLYYGDYDFTGDYRFAGATPPTGRYVEIAKGEWWGGELRLRKTLAGGHKLILGVESQRNARQDQLNAWLDPYDAVLDDHRKSRRLGVYVQDEYVLSPGWLLNAGLRFDDYSLSSSAISPRLALIHGAGGNSVVKLLYGTAFRTPNVYEFFYSYPGQNLTNPDLKPERIKTWEAVWEYQPRDDFRFSASAYRYEIEDLVNVRPVGNEFQFQNEPKTRAGGLELEGERWWQGGARLRLAASFQRTRDSSGRELSSSPHQLAKMNWSLPLPEGWRLGVDAQYLGSRLTDAQLRIPSFWLGNLTLLRQQPADRWTFSAGIYNLFDRKYFDPAALNDPATPDRDRMEQDGRTVRFKLQYRM